MRKRVGETTTLVNGVEELHTMAFDDKTMRIVFITENNHFLSVDLTEAMMLELQTKLLNHNSVPKLLEEL